MLPVLKPRLPETLVSGYLSGAKPLSKADPYRIEAFLLRF